MKVNPRFQQGNYERNIERTNQLRAMASDMSVSTSGLAIAWLRQATMWFLFLVRVRLRVGTGADLELSPSDVEAIEKVLPLAGATEIDTLPINGKGPSGTAKPIVCRPQLTDDYSNQS